MFAITFDMVISDLKENYNEKYHRAYFEIKEILLNHSFEWIQGSTYITKSDDLSTLFGAIMALKNVDWFKNSVRDIRGFKVENWSDFTDLVKN